MKRPTTPRTVRGMDPANPVGSEEEFQSIPWSTLTMDAGRPPWLVYVAAGAVVSLVVGVLLARTFRSPTPAPAEELATPTTSVESLSGPGPEPTVLEEADLRAALEPGSGGIEQAVAAAEMFVREYFTVDGARDRGEALAVSLGWEPMAVEDALTYVEWTRAWNATESSDGHHEVSVVFQVVTSVDYLFERGPVMAVVVSLQATPDGRIYVTDLPQPAVPPVAAPGGREPPPMDEVPHAVATEARRLAARWGSDPEVLGGSETDGSWRVVVTTTDGSGTPWPLTVTVEDLSSAGGGGAP